MYKTIVDLEEVKQQVQSGINFLDNHIPGWENEIDIHKLELSDCAKCVLGQIGAHRFSQLCAEYSPDISPYGVLAGEFNLPCNLQQNLGFFSYNPGRYWALNEEWIRRIQERLEVKQEKVEAESQEPVTVG